MTDDYPLRRGLRLGLHSTERRTGREGEKNHEMQNGLSLEIMNKKNTLISPKALALLHFTEYHEFKSTKALLTSIEEVAQHESVDDATEQISKRRVGHGVTASGLQGGQ